MKELVANPKRFFFFALAVLLFSALLHMVFNFRDYTRIAAYPYQDQGIFYEESVAVSLEGDFLVRRLGGGAKTKDEAVQLVPVGITVGVRFYTDGIMVLGTDKVTGPKGVSHPSLNKLETGDVLLKADSVTMFNLSQLVQTIETADGPIVFEVLRDGKISNVEVTPAKDESDVFKIGCWVRDSTQGIGTITYYDPATGRFGALGHGIMDVDTQKLMTVRHGQIMESHIIDVRKGKKGAPGELIGEIKPDCIIGAIKKNTTLGIYGDVSRGYNGLPTAAVNAARHDQIIQGPAKIFSNIEGGEIKSYDVYIESVNRDANADKGLVVRITDQGLITRSGGIVQGMSGSPILQNDRIVGAITHVFVQNPLRGYGVFIEKMLAEEKQAMEKASALPAFYYAPFFLPRLS